MIVAAISLLLILHVLSMPTYPRRRNYNPVPPDVKLRRPDPPPPPPRKRFP